MRGRLGSRTVFVNQPHGMGPVVVVVVVVAAAAAAAAAVAAVWHQVCR